MSSSSLSISTLSISRPPTVELEEGEIEEESEDQNYYTGQARKHSRSDSSSSWTRTSTPNPNSNGYRLSSRPRRPPISKRPSMRPDSREGYQRSPRGRVQSPHFHDSRTTSPLPTLSGEGLGSGRRLASPSPRRRDLSPSPRSRSDPTPEYETRTPPREGDHDKSKTSSERSSQISTFTTPDLRRDDSVMEGKPMTSSCPLTGSSSTSHWKSSSTSSHTDTAVSQDSSDGVDSLETRITDETQDTWCGDDLAMEPLLHKDDVDLSIRRVDTESPLAVNPTDAHFSPLTLNLDTPSPQSSAGYNQETNVIFDSEPHSTSRTRGRSPGYEISGIIDQIETGLASLALGSRDRDQDTSITRWSFGTAARYRHEHEGENLAGPQHEAEDPMSALVLLVDTTIESWSEAKGNDEEPAVGGPKRPGHEKGNEYLDGKKRDSEVKCPGPQVEHSAMAVKVQKSDLAKPAIQPAKEPEPKRSTKVEVKVEHDSPVLQPELAGNNRQTSLRLEAQLNTASAETASIPLLSVLRNELGSAPQNTRYRPLENGSRHPDHGHGHAYAPTREHECSRNGVPQPQTGAIVQPRSMLVPGQVHPTATRAVPSTGGRFVTAPIPTFDQLRARRLKTNPLSHVSARPMGKRERIALFQAWYRARPVPVCFPTPLSGSNLPDFDTRSGLWNRHPAPGITTGHREDLTQSGAAADLPIQPRPILPNPRQFPGIYLPAPIRDDGFVAGRQRHDLPEIPSVLRQTPVPLSHNTPPHRPAETTEPRPLEHVMREARRNSPWNVVDLGLVAAKYKSILYPDMNPQPEFDDPIQIDRALTLSRCYTDEDSEILYAHFLMTIHDLLPLATRSACSAGTLEVPAVQTLRRIAANAREFWPMDSVLPSRVDLFIGWIESVLIQGNSGWVLAEIDGEAFNPDTRSDRRE